MSPSPAARPRSQLLFGMLVFAYGVGMLASIKLFARAAADSTAVARLASNASLSFTLCGAALLFAWWSPARLRWPVSLAGGAALLVALFQLAQPLGDIQPSLLLPGGMRLGTSLAFLLAGAALILLPWLHGRARLVVPVGGLAVILMALPSLFSNMLGNVLFDHARLSNLLLPLPTALGLVALGLGLVCSHSPTRWPGLWNDREDRRIFATSFLLLSLMSLVASMVGVGVVGRYAMDHFQQAWLSSFRSNAELFSVAVDGAASRSADIARFSGLDSVVTRALPSEALQRELERVARLARLGEGGSLAVRSADGATLARTGRPHLAGQFSVALPLPLEPRLYWQDGWRLATAVPLSFGGELLVELVLEDFNRQYRTLNQAGASGEVRVCAPSDGGFSCFPSRLRPVPTTFPTEGNRELPMARAIAGEHDVSAGRDYRGQDVIAAYGTVRGLGLALVQKIDAEEFYRPLRRQLWAALVGMTLLVLAGSSILYWRTHPLVQGLLRTRARLDAILNNLPVGVITFNGCGQVASANRAACEMFGYDRASLLRKRLCELVPDCHILLQGELPAGPQQLAGRHANGAPIEMEILATKFLVGGEVKRLAIMQDVAERLRMEQALRQREASLAHAQQLAHIGSWERVLADGTQFWSDETFRIFQIEPGRAALTRDQIQALVHPDDRALKLRAEQDALAGLRPYDVSFRVVLPRGVIKVLHSRAEIESDGAGRPVRMRGTIQDITEKTWADEQLRKREEEYRALVENSPDVVIRFDRELRCVYVNQAIAGAPGLHGVVRFGAVLDAPMPDSPAAPWVVAVRTALATGQTDSFEVVAGEGADASHYQVQVVPEFRREGRVAAVLATARDISAIRHGEAVLRESQRRLAAIAANTPGAVFQVVRSAEGKRTFTYVSEGVMQLFGETPAAVLAQPDLLVERILPAERAHYHASVEHSARTLETLNWEGRAYTMDGREIWVNCRATPRRKGDETIWEGVMLNITESKRSEQQIEESRRLLRELSAHREHVREEERKKIAREVHDELGQALTALRMDVALLRLADGPHSPALLARIAAMKEAVDRTIGIVRNVTSALRPAALDLGLTAALEWQVDEFARYSGIECLLHTGEVEVVLDDGEATALFRIVQESLTNVLKHAEASEVSVTLEATGAEVCLEIADNGRGFQAGVPPRPGKFGLMGMRERVLVLGGSVDIQSKVGEGTCVTVRLPMKTPGAVAA